MLSITAGNTTITIEKKKIKIKKNTFLYFCGNSLKLQRVFLSYTS